jgi:hypothetical protein
MAEDIVEEPRSAPTAVITEIEERHSASLLEQFYLTLNVTYLTAPRVDRSPVHDRIDRLFNDPRSWRNAYEIEQLLCFVLTEQQLATELERRLAEAKALKIDHVDTIDKELHPNPAEAITAGDKRIILHRLLNDLQWFYTKRMQHRAASKRLMQRVSLLFMSALITLFLMLFIQFFAHGRPSAPAGQQAAPDVGGTTPAGGQTVPGGGQTTPPEPGSAPAQPGSTTQG